MSGVKHNSATNDTTDSNGPFEFLKTVVSDGVISDKNNTDSDKENDHRLVTISEESTEGKPPVNSSIENPRDTSQGCPQSQVAKFGAGVGLGNASTSRMAKDEEKEMWEDFYNEQDFTAKKDLPPPPLTNGVHGHVTTTFELESNGNNNLNNRVLDKVEEEREDPDERSQTDDYSSIFDSSVRDDDEADNSRDRTQSGENNNNANKKRPRKKRRLFVKRRLPPPLPHSSMVTTTQRTGGSHPDLGRSGGDDVNNNNNSNSNGRHTQHLETMSESGGAGNNSRGRRLSRRKQVSRPRCAGPTPSGDVLQQKYQELESLVTKPLPNPAVYVTQTRQQMMRLQGLGSQYHASNHHHQPAGSGTNGPAVNGLPPPPPARDDNRRHQHEVIVEAASEQGYSSIRTLQVLQGGANSSTPTTRQNRPHTAHPSRRPNPYSGGRTRPASAGRQRPATAHRPREDQQVAGTTSTHGRRGRGPHRGGTNKRRGGRSNSGSGAGTQRSDSESKDYSSRDSRDSRNASSDNQDRSSSRSPNRVIAHTDTQLKHSSNPSIRDWLKAKNVQERQQKSEERKKKRKERAEKQEQERQKQESLQDSEKKVKEWMVKKRKEAWRKAKEEKKKAQEEEFERLERQGGHGNYTGALRGRSIERPQSAPAHSDRKMFIPVIRPDGDQTTNNTNAKDQCNGESPCPHPPKSKFVYKRPVSGRVRLMKLQQERKENSKKQEKKKREEEMLTEEEKNRKMRMSYDQWLLKKRQEDYEKRQKLAQQRALAKSDPELERIVPEMARRRIENIQRGKKPIRTNVESIDEKLNKSFGGGDFDTEHAPQNGAAPESPGFQVSGQKKSLGQRPGSAKAPSANSSPLNPQMSRSPRRPKSAHPRVQSSVSSSEEGRVIEAKEFQLPFPAELGVPKYVAQRQEKLFSSEVFADASTKASASSSETQAQDTESQKNLAGTQESTSTSHSVQSQDVQNGNFDTEKIEQIQNGSSELEELEPQMPACAEVTEHSIEDENPSFFVTDGNIDETETTVEADLEDALEQSLEDKEEQNDSEINQNNNEIEEDDDVNEDKMGEQGTDEMNGGEVEEETSKACDDQQEQESSDYKSKDDDLFGEENESEGLQSPVVDEEAEIPSLAEEQSIVSGSAPPRALDQSESEQTESETPKDDGEIELKGEAGEDEEPKSEASESRHSTKHVSFDLEAVVHEDPLAGIPPEDYEVDTEDEEAEDQRGDFYGDGGLADDAANEFDDDEYF